MEAYPCQICDKIIDIDTCARCRLMNKYTFALYMQGEPRIYIEERNHYNKGRKKKEYKIEELQHIMDLYARFRTIRNVAEVLGINKDKVQRMVKIARREGITCGGGKHE